MTARVLPDRDCIICGNPVPPKPKGKRGAQSNVCSDPCRRQREQAKHKAENTAARERKAAWYLANRERIRADWLAAQTAETRAVARARTRHWARSNPEWRAANRRAWARAHPNKSAERRRRRRARERNVPFDKVTVDELLSAQNFGCHICGNVIDPARRYPDPECPTVDHVIPLARGGTGLRENLRAAHMRCNSIKGTRLVSL